MANETKHEARMRLAPVFENPDNEGAWHVGFCAGYDAGRSAREWRRVEDEWVTEIDEYWVTRRVDGGVVKRWLHPLDNDDRKSLFIAWMPVEQEPEPYTEEERA